MLKFGPCEDDAVLFELPEKMTKVFDRDLKAAGIAKRDARGRSLAVHALRHTFGTLLAKAGVPLQRVQSAMRHSTPALTLRLYVHLDLGDIAGAVANLPALSGHKEESAAVHAETSNLTSKTPLIPPLTGGKAMQISANSGKTGIGIEDGGRRLGHQQKIAET